MRVVVIAVGEMGAGIGGRLASRGIQVATSLAGRSEASAARAHRASIEIVDGTDTVLLDGADVVLSIVPPARAMDLAHRLAPALAARNGQTLFVDCNAVSPQTVREVAAIVAPTGAPFVDVGIIGTPPRTDDDDAGPRLYASGDAVPRFMALSGFGLDLRIVDGGIGAASALKMSYASLTKGLTALGLTLSIGAARDGVAQALRGELEESQPMLMGWLMRQLPTMYAKAYRWDGEMSEIARFLAPEPGATTFQGAAATYTAFAKAWAAEGRESAAVKAVEAVFHKG